MEIKSKYEEYAKNLIVNSSPHVKDKDSTSKIMRNVLIALIPALLFGIYNFGLRALVVTLVAAIVCVVSEALTEKAMKKKITISDLSAVVTGVLIAFNVPVTMPLWQVAIASIFAIVIVKQLFGGIGKNFMNPALAARAFLMASWPINMSNFTAPSSDAVSMATPLSGGESIKLFDMFIGNMPGTIGEVSKLALLIGLAILLITKVIKLHIPVIYIGSMAVFYVLFEGLVGGFSIALGNLPAQLLSGGLFLGAIFMATDYATTPRTTKGQIIFAVGCGLLTSLFRVFGGYPEGVIYAILLMNVATPIIDKYTIPVQFGGER